MPFRELFSKRADSIIKPGLERIDKAYQFLKKPSHNIPSILIGGTNGKGTTAGFLWHMMAASGLRAGLYTSPHLISFCERIQLSHRKVTDEELLRNLEDLKKNLPGPIYDELSFFEVATLLAFKLFEIEKNEINILEVGMGGRWDATNISAPVISAIVGVGFDHEKYLGNTLEKIAYEKAGIIKQNVPIFIGSGGDLFINPEALHVIKKEAQQKDSPIYFFNEHFGLAADESFFINIPDIGLEKTIYKFPDRLKNQAPFLKRNYCLAAAMYCWFCRNCISYTWDLEEILQAFPHGNVDIPFCINGRFQTLNVAFKDDFPKKQFLIDVCHNPDGAKALREAITGDRNFSDGLSPALISILNDKEINGMLDIFKGFLGPIMLFRINSDRSWKFSDLADRHKDLQFFESFELALKGALEKWSPSKPWIICGSVMAIGEVIDYFSAIPDAKNNSSVTLNGRSNLSRSAF